MGSGWSRVEGVETGGENNAECMAGMYVQGGNGFMD